MDEWEYTEAWADDESLGDAWDEESVGEAWIASSNGYHEAAAAALGYGWGGAPHESVDAAINTALRSMTPNQAEDFWGTVSSLVQKAAPIAAQLIPIAAPIIGTAIGGPAGTAIGGMVGNLAGQALAGAVAPPPTTPTPQAVSSAMPVRPPTPAPAVPPAAVPTLPTLGNGPGTLAALGGGSIATLLMSFLQNPSFLQSLLGQILAPSGGGTVRIGAGAESVTADFPMFANTLSVLAAEAASEAARFTGDSFAAGESEVPAYMLHPSGALRGDPASAESRAAVFLEQLRQTPRPQADGAAAVEWLIQAGVAA